MATLEHIKHGVETGLLAAQRIKGRTGQRMKLRERMTRYKVPGFSIALIEEDEIVWAQGYGLLEDGKNEPVTPEIRFQAASISKPVTAMAALSLVQAGLLDLDSDVNERLRSWQIPDNEFTQNQKVTLRGLLSHTAGMSVMGYRGYPAGAAIPTLAQILDGEPPANSDPVRVTQEPRKGYSYSGGGYTVLQQLLEDVTGQPFADLLQDLVLDKLDMANSSFAQPLPEAANHQAATAHWSNGKPVPGKWHVYPELAAAGLWSTPSDLAQFAVEILRAEGGESNKVLSFNMTRQMLSRQPASWIGLGLAIIELDGWTRFEHPGWNEGFHSYMCGFIGTGQGVAWMANGENGKLLGQEVMRGLARLYGWPGFEPQAQTLIEIDPASYARYAGSYRFADEPDWGVDIVQEDGRLLLQDTPDGLDFVLYPTSETDFFALERPEAISFIADTEGNVEAVMLGEYVRLDRVPIEPSNPVPGS